MYYKRHSELVSEYYTLNQLSSRGLFRKISELLGIVQTTVTNNDKVHKGLGGPVVAQQKQIRLGAMRLQVRSLALLSGVRIWCCHELWCRSQTRLESHIAVALA